MIKIRRSELLTLNNSEYTSHGLTPEILLRILYYTVIAVYSGNPWSKINFLNEFSELLESTTEFKRFKNLIIFYLRLYFLCITITKRLKYKPLLIFNFYYLISNKLKNAKLILLEAVTFSLGRFTWVGKKYQFRPRSFFSWESVQFVLNV